MEQDAYDYQDVPDATTPIVSAETGWRMRDIMRCR